jgi:transcriptional regulator with XRE-family HTH domain
MIRQWRKFRGLTMDAFAERLGVSTIVVSRIERGQQPYRQDFLERAAEVLRCEPADLIVRDPTAAPDIWATYEELDPASKAVAAAMLDALLRRGK